jgi:Uma2 family endonuclease
MPVMAVLTSDQFSALPDEFDKNGNRIRQELISGELVEMPPSFELHNVVKRNIVKALIAYELANPELAIAVVSEMAFVVTDHDTFVPDACVIRDGRLNPRNQKYTPGAPELAIEVVSPNDTAAHLKSKVDVYLQAGAKTVWVIYPGARSVMIYSGQSLRELRGDQMIDDPLLPGFSVPVSAFFELT